MAVWDSPAGAINTKLAVLRQWVSNSATFQSRVSPATQAQALNHIHQVAYPVTNANWPATAWPRAVLSVDDSEAVGVSQFGAARNASSVNYWRGQIHIQLFDVAQDDDIDQATWTWREWYAQVIDEIRVQNGADATIDTGVVSSFHIEDRRSVAPATKSEGQPNTRWFEWHGVIEWT